ncbi:hypothetical protein AB0M46_28145 [Dactylosporangium sp. NPDC051485]|uniref:hypothetical protein n=1 Tax=Dactylosporangium sp. NPDC051485 TaxID=3154846 RepID=UPI003448C8CD
MIDARYEVRYRVSRAVWGLVAAGLLAGTAALALGGSGDEAAVVAAACYAASVTVLALYGHAALTRKVGLRVDEEGIRFGGRPPLYRPADTVPWRAVSTIYLYRVRVAGLTQSYVGLQAPDGAPPLPQRVPANVVRMIYHVPSDAAAASYSADGFPLDPAAFAAAVARVAPSVQVVDLTAVAPTLMPTPRV